MIITVTQKHIDSGQQNECRKCPVALAIAEVTKYDPWVSNDCVFFYEYLQCAKYVDLPQAARTKINLYDLTKGMEPFSFEMDIPQWALKCF